MIKLDNFILGSLLGDGAFIKKSEKHNTYICFKHCEAQFDYLNWKYIYLKENGLIRNKSKGIVRVNITEKGTYPNYQTQYRFNTISSKYLNQFKRMTELEMAEHFNSEVLAIWILDDANIYKKVTKISTGTHSIEFCNKIIEYMNNKLELDAHLYQHPITSVKNYISIPAHSYEKVKDIILEVVPADIDIVRYKLNIRESSQKLSVKIKYFSDITPITYIGQDISNWIDLRAAETIEMKAGDFKLIPLGVGMILPDGYEANIVPRSSTFKNFGIIQTNSFGVIDNSYSGDNDQWFFPAYALRDTIIHKNDRICQFRLNKIQGDVEFIEVEHLDDVDRGGIGSTGVK